MDTSIANELYLWICPMYSNVFDPHPILLLLLTLYTHEHDNRTEA